MRRNRLRSTLVLFATLALLALPAVAAAETPFEGPLFGLGTDHNGDTIVADAARGVATADGDLIAALPGVTDVAASDRGWIWAITGLGDVPGDQTLYKVYLDGAVVPFADLGAFEEKRNPHPDEIDSNPYSVADLGRGAAVVADAGGNTLLRIDKSGRVGVIAVLPDELVSTANAKAIVEEIVSNLFGFPVTCDTLPAEAPQDAFDTCGLPDMIPAQSVPTSVAIAPNGDFVVGELKGFPAPTGESRLWRIPANARNADCGDPLQCRVAHDGFTSIVDVAFGHDGTLYVAELDEKSWFAVELLLFEGLPLDLGLGTVNACRGRCVPVTSAPLLSALTVDGTGNVWTAGLFGPVQPLS
ncbi:MAG TPA: ScyD/ScyE family protein [Acidimicrobiia bacterium]|nr:ScyD/ScyE family protein [Acidimicrobiia bacterium]